MLLWSKRSLAKWGVGSSTMIRDSALGSCGGVGIFCTECSLGEWDVLSFLRSDVGEGEGSGDGERSRVLAMAYFLKNFIGNT